MITYKAMLIAAIAASILYVAARFFWNEREGSNNYNHELHEILTKEEHKVKGRND